MAVCARSLGGHETGVHLRVADGRCASRQGQPLPFRCMRQFPTNSSKIDCHMDSTCTNRKASITTHCRPIFARRPRHTPPHDPHVPRPHRVLKGVVSVKAAVHVTIMAIFVFQLVLVVFRLRPCAGALSAPCICGRRSAERAEPRPACRPLWGRRSRPPSSPPRLQTKRGA